MKWLRALSLLVLAALPLALVGEEAKDEKKVETIGSIEKLDDAFHDLIPKDAKLEKLADGFAWTEGPVWVKKGGYLLFSDIPNNRIVKWQEGKKVSDFLKPAGYLGKRTDFKEPGTNGLLLDADGKLVMMEHGDR